MSNTGPNAIVELEVGLALNLFCIGEMTAFNDALRRRNLTFRFVGNPEDVNAGGETVVLIRGRAWKMIEWLANDYTDGDFEAASEGIEEVLKQSTL